MARPPASAPAAARPGLFRRTPPAIFPGIFGLFGLGLAWRHAGQLFLLPTAISELLLGAVSLLYLFALTAYLAKLVRRPGVVPEDLRVLPGRAGLATMTQGAMLLAAALVPYSPTTASAVLIAAVAGHTALALLVIGLLATGAPEQRRVTPVWHLTFVGFIVAPIAALPLGMTVLAQACTVFAAVMAGVVFGVSTAQLLRGDPPPPLRPLLAIHLAPMALFGTAAVGFGHARVAVVFGVLAIGVAAALGWKARYLTVAGFSPLWSAFTFPLTAFAALMLMLSGRMGGAAAPVFQVIGTVALIAATVIVPWIVVKVLKLWARGTLAARTNAAML